MSRKRSRYTNILRVLLIVGFILLIPLIAMQFTDEMAWDLFDFVLMGAVLSGVGLAYEFIAKKSEKTVYRAAFAIGLLGALLLVWINGAVGIIGSENNPANLLYGAVFVVGLLGSLLSRFKARGMAYTLFIAAIVQFLVPLFALFVWPAKATWGEPGVIGVLILNAVFALVFALSGLLFYRSNENRLRDN